MPISKVPSLILSIISLACKKMPSMLLLFLILILMLSNSSDANSSSIDKLNKIEVKSTY